MTKTHVIVLGGGLVGGFIARRLANDEQFRVTLVDRDETALARASGAAALAGRQSDLAAPEGVAAAVADADLVIGALPGHLGYQALQAVIASGKPVIDISFFPQDPLGLAADAAKRGLTVVVDCGVMPGLGGMLAVHLGRGLQEAQGLRILVGGLPAAKKGTTQYKAPFSPTDVIEQYTRPARLRVDGEVVQRPALSDVEQIDFPGIGLLEAFNTDGLRTLLTTLNLPDMCEKTLRYPGHAQQMRLLRELGFFGETPREVDGQPVSPLRLTSRLLFDEWLPEQGTEELTALRVEVWGLQDGALRTLRCDLLDRTDPRTGETSMARTTGYPALLAAQLLARGKLNRFGPGIVPAERLGEDDEVFRFVLEGLIAAGIQPEFAEV